MKFMITWRVHPDRREDVFKAFTQMSPADDEKDTSDKVKLIGRWHDISSFNSVAICEPDDPMALPVGRSTEIQPWTFRQQWC